MAVTSGATVVDLVSPSPHHPAGEKAGDCHGKQAGRQQQMDSLGSLKGSKQTARDPAGKRQNDYAQCQQAAQDGIADRRWFESSRAQSQNRADDAE